jgi:streptogramin lyase
MGGLVVFLGLLATIVLTAGRISTVSGFPIYQYALPAIELVPGPITVDRKNDVWFAEEAGMRIGELRTDGTLHVYQVPGTGEQIQALAAADDGKVWFTQTQTHDGSRNRVGYFRPDGRATIYQLLRKNAFVKAIVSDANGGAWVSELFAHRVAHVSGAGVIKEFLLPGPAAEIVRSIDVDPDGTVWALQDDAVVQLSRTGVARRFVIPIPASVNGMRNMVRAGTDSWWMTAYTAKGHDPEIWRFTTPDRLVRYKLPGSGLGPVVIAAGAQGSAWMAYNARVIARIDPSGNITQYTLPFAGFDVWGMAANDLGDLWFVNSQSEKLGVFGPNISQEPHPTIAPLTANESEVFQAWQSTLQPRSSYDMQQVVADTLRVDQDFAVVGWSDEDGNAATLMRRSAGRWIPVFVTNGNFYRPQDLTSHGVPAGVATQLLRDSNVVLVPHYAEGN